MKYYLVQDNYVKKLEISQESDLGRMKLHSSESKHILYKIWINYSIKCLVNVNNILLHRVLFYSGRIICITSARDDDSIRSLAEIAMNTIVQQNKKASTPQPPTSTDASAAPQ